ncbi:MAG: hypothetical protein QOI73_2879 [Solirubrobacteraceae bacterium]|nr:hypothetical protein [Solirubrobacteraceae bacterium]
MRRGGLLDVVGRYARMTREDAEQLIAVFWQVASRQARDVRESLANRLR